jgi:carbamoyltransferase
MYRNYVGLATSFHDSALAIVDSQGEVRFAEATERSLQSKRALCMTPDLVHHTGEIIRQHCESDAEIIAAHSWTPPADQSLREILQPFSTLRATLEARYGDNIPEALLVQLIAMRHAAVSMWNSRAFSGYNLDFELGRIGWGRPFVADRRGYDHHLTHAAASCFSSPFDEATCAIVDGVGEGTACAFFAYRNGELKPLMQRESGTGSLGFFYLKVCLACGFGILTGEEWKAMGLAAYGKPDAEFIDFFRGAIKLEGLALHDADTDVGPRLALYELRNAARKSFHTAANLAFAGQLVFTETLIALLRNLYPHGGSSNLVLGGGCALNSSANGAILEQTPFRRLHVFCAPADDGNAVGAAQLGHRQDHPEFRPRPRVQSPYLGSRMSQETLGNLRRFSKVMQCASDAPVRAAEMLARGKIIGWIQGRAEFGPRALGNRSILADPRSAHIRDQINSRVKFREEFRPFAPSILHQFGAEYFENYQESPYMERTLRFRQEVLGRVPGVVHLDGTGRLQTVKREWNAPFYDLIEHFRLITGIPLVLNTSFNVMEKPISHSVEDVLAVFHSCGLDAVFLEDVLLEK